MTLQGRIKETRKDLDIGQKQIADKLNITQQQYSLYERGLRPLPASLLPDICLALGTSADYILGLPKDLRWPRA